MALLQLRRRGNGLWWRCMGAQVGRSASLCLCIWRIPYVVYRGRLRRAWPPTYDGVLSLWAGSQPPSLGAGGAAGSRPTLCNVSHGRVLRASLWHLRLGSVTSVVVYGVALAHGQLVLTPRCIWRPHYGNDVLSRKELGAYGGVQSGPGTVVQVL